MSCWKAHPVQRGTSASVRVGRASGAPGVACHVKRKAHPVQRGTSASMSGASASVRVASASMRVGVLVFPGTNSEEETARACEAVGLETDIVHWKTPERRVREYAALVLAGGFAYEDRVRAGAIAAHDRLVDVVREAAAEGKPVLGICNGAQILLEAGLVPGFAAPASVLDQHHPQAGFTRNAPHG